MRWLLPSLTYYFRTFGAIKSREDVKKYWWKILGAILVLYSLIMGLTIPLGPGIDHVSKTIFEDNSEIELVVTGYSSNYEDGEVQAWLQNGEIDLEDFRYAFKADAVEVLSGHQAKVRFSLPDHLPSKSCHLYLYNSTDGTTILENAIHLNGNTLDKSQTYQGIQDQEPIPLAEAGHFHFPNRALLVETVRNLFFHVPMWFAMMTVMAISLVFSIMYLRGFKMKHDLVSVEMINVAVLFGLMGVATGSVWARATWQDWWVTSDNKLNGAAITLLIYLAYLILRNSIEDEQKRAKVAAVYNIFAFVMMIVFIMVWPRITDTLHPGNGGNPAFSQYDLDNSLRSVFYFAVLGWILIAVWMGQLRVRIGKINRKLLWDED